MIRCLLFYVFVSGCLLGATYADRPQFKDSIITGYVRGGHIRWNWIGDEHVNKTNDIIYMHAFAGADGSLLGVEDFTVKRATAVSWLPSFDGQQGVFQFSDKKSRMVSQGNMLPADLKNFTIEFLLCPKGVQDTVLLRTGEFQLSWKGDKLLIQQGTVCYQAVLPNLPEGKWMKLACLAKDGAFSVVVDGKWLELKESTAPALKPVGGNSYIGVKYVGLMDEFRVWKEFRKPFQLHKPIVPGWVDRLLFVHLKADDEKNMGLDHGSWYSQICWLRSRLKNPKNHMVRLGVVGGGWKDMLMSEEARQRFANEVASVVNTYKLDGVDLDFEWIEGPHKGQSNAQQWENYADLAQRVRQAHPKMCFTISLHVVCFRMPKKGIDAVDYITFQNYGPSSARYPFEDFSRSLEAFRKQGFPDHKIMLSVPFQGTGDASANSVRLYRDIVAQHPDLPPSADTVEFAYSDTNKSKMTFNGADMIRKKCEYAKAQGLRGIMYWDMGGDVKHSNEDPRTNYQDPRALLPVINEVLKGKK